MLHRYHHRFGGTGTVVTAAGGLAFTAAHCLAAVDGAPGVVIAAATGHGSATGAARWRVVKRWSPAATDLALLHVLPPMPAGRRIRLVAGAVAAAPRLAARELVQPGVALTFYGHGARGFQVRAATVLSVTATTATAAVSHPAGVCGNDSGGPVFVDGTLVGIVTHRAGPEVSAHCSSHLIFTRLDARPMRRRIRAAFAAARADSQNTNGRAAV